MKSTELGRIEPYRPRAFRFLELWEIESLRLKVYGIDYHGGRPGAELVAAARRVAQQRVRLSAPATNHHGVGFVGIHQGKTGNFVFVDWWADENELHHHVYGSTDDAPGELVYLTPTGAAACVWDLHLLHFEREAWVRWAMASPGPDLESYLDARLEEDA